MRLATAPGPVALVALLLLLHFSLRPWLAGWAGAPDLLTGGLLVAALRLRAGYAAALGSVLGLLEAAMALRGLGTLMIVYALVGYAAARSRDLLFSDARAFFPLYVFLGVWVAHAGVALLGGGLDPRLALLEAPMSAGLTAAVCWVAERAFSFLLA